MSTTTTGHQAATEQLDAEPDRQLLVELKFTWQNTVTTLLALIENGDSEGQRFAKHEFSRMAIAADFGSDALLRLSALLAEGKLIDDQAAHLVDRARSATAGDRVARTAATSQAAAVTKALGYLAQQCGCDLELTVCRSARGFYIGTRDVDGSPFSRESMEYWLTREAAEAALASGTWNQKLTP